MAQARLADSKLRLVFETGTDEKGLPIHKTKTFSNIKDGATAEQLLQVATAVSALCNDTLVTIERADNSEIFA